MQSMSRSSVMSAGSSKILEEVTAKSQSRYSHRNSAGSSPWRASSATKKSEWYGTPSVGYSTHSGLYLSKNMRMGRGVTVPKFGIFTFTPPEIRLKVQPTIIDLGCHQSRGQGSSPSQPNICSREGLRLGEGSQARNLLSSGVRSGYPTLHRLRLKRISPCHKNQLD